MSDPLASYLHDHLGGANFAINLLDVLGREHRDEPLGIFVNGLKIEVEEDRATLQEVVQRVGGGSGAALKQAFGWVGEKTSRLKLRHHATDALGTFEALEGLALGLLGKRALWDALATLQPAEARLAGFDFSSLATRAADQHARVEAQRLLLAPQALASSEAGATVRP